MPRFKAARAVQSVITPVAPAPRPATPPHAEQPPAGPLWISAAEAAAQLGLTIEALKARAYEGRLGFKEGGRWRFSPADLKRYTDTIESRHLRRFPRR